MPNRGFCPVCLREVSVTKAGNARVHGRTMRVSTENWFGVPQGRKVHYTDRGCVGAGERVKVFVSGSNNA